MLLDPTYGLLRLQLKALEAVQLLLDPPLVRARRATADPGPFLHQKLPLRAVGLEVDGGDDVVADQRRQRKVSEHPLLLGDVSIEAVLVVEEQMQPLELMDKRIE